MKHLNIMILWGLPGSGKTTYAKQIANQKNRYMHFKEIRVIEENEIRKINDIIPDLLGPHTKTVIIDSLVTTNIQCQNVISTIKLHKDWEYTYKIVYWKEDRDSCIYNDKYRRKKSSRVDIKKLPFEPPNLSLFPSQTTVECMEVTRKPMWQTWAQKEGIYDESGYINSDRWTTGGEWGNCWGDRGNFAPDVPPSSFKELDDILERIVPDIKIIQYRQIYNQAVSSDTATESGYYGTYHEYAYYKCSLEKLYELLKQYGYIENE